MIHFLNKKKKKDHLTHNNTKTAITFCNQRSSFKWKVVDPIEVLHKFMWSLFECHLSELSELSCEEQAFIDWDHKMKEKLALENVIELKK